MDAIVGGARLKGGEVVIAGGLGRPSVRPGRPVKFELVPPSPPR